MHMRTQRHHYISPGPTWSKKGTHSKTSLSSASFESSKTSLITVNSWLLHICAMPTGKYCLWISMRQIYFGEIFTNRFLVVLLKEEYQTVNTSTQLHQTAEFAFPVLIHRSIISNGTRMWGENLTWLIVAINLFLTCIACSNCDVRCVIWASNSAVDGGSFSRELVL